MDLLADKIVNFTEYLISLGYSVSMHFLPEIVKRFPYKIWRKLLKYNFHGGPYCIKIKACGKSENVLSINVRSLSRCPWLLAVINVMQEFWNLFTRSFLYQKLLGTLR